MLAAVELQGGAMSQQTSLRWQDRTLDELFDRLPEEHRRRAQRLLAHLITFAARETTTEHRQPAGCDRGELAAVDGGVSGGAKQGVADGGRRSFPLLLFDEGDGDLAARSEQGVGTERECAGAVLDADRAAVPTAGHKGATR